MSETKKQRSINHLIIEALENAKAQEIVQLDVRAVSDITEAMIICHGTSDSHVSALARHVLDDLSDKGYKTFGIEGQDSNEWILIDYFNVIVHIMKRETRDLYDLESLWDTNLNQYELRA